MPAKKSEDAKTPSPKTTTAKKKAPVAKKKTPVAKKTTTARKRTTAKKPVAKTPVTANQKATKVMSAVEKQFDEGMKDTQKFIKKNVGKKTKKTVKTIGATAETVASSIEHLGEEVEHVADNIFPTSAGSQGVYNAQFAKKISRLFVFRFLRLIIQLPVIFIWSIWYAIITVIHYLQMFVMAERSIYLWNKQVRFWKHVIAWKSYFNIMTDARPEIIHPEVK